MMGVPSFVLSAPATAVLSSSSPSSRRSRRKSSPDGLILPISSSRFVTNWRATSTVNPRFDICKITTGMSSRAASSNSSKHHGRDRTPFVASSTMQSL
eukprot:6012748-Prymnesium_polylepis.1